jgi:AraC-like DNA-binding protein
MLTLRAQDYFTDPGFPFWIKRHPQRAFPPHRHEFLEFFYLPSGSLGHTLSTRHGPQTLHGGDLILLSPEHWHSFKGPESDAAAGAEIVTCLFQPALLEPFGPSLRHAPHLLELLFLVPFHDQGLNVLHLTGLTQLRVRLLLEEMVDEFERRPAGWPLAIQAKLMDLLVMLARTFTTQRALDRDCADQPSSARQVIVQCLDDLERNYAQPLTLATYAARKAGFSKEYFCTLFRQVTGRTFVDYVTELRLRRARELLGGTRTPVTAICHQCGFNDISYFNRVFRRRVGCSPGAYRRQAAASAELNPAKDRLR